MNTNTELLEFTGMIALRVTLVLMLGGVVSLLLRRSSAALRHWVWVLAMCAALLMPAFVMIAPRWNVELPTKTSLTDAPYQDESKDTSVNPIMRPTVNALLPATNNQTDADPPVTTVSNSSGVTVTPTLAAQPNTDKRPDTRIAWPSFTTMLIVVWAIGAVGILWMGVRHYGKFRRVTTHTHPNALEVPHEITELAAELRRNLAIRRPVRLMMTPEISIPMTIGVVRPIILLPPDAATWDAERRRVVLLHESIHIARWDALLGWLSLFVVALHWFNPLAWVATRRLAIESENACDDRVLQLGTTGPDYAAHLVAIAQNFLGSLRHKSFVTPGLAQMTQIGNLPSRVHAILDKQRRRSASRWQKALGLLLVLSLITPVATIAGGQNTPMTQPNRAYADDAITLTVGLPEDFLNSFNRTGLSLDEFEAAHPGVKVVLRRDDSGWLENAAPSDPEAYLNDITDFADTADVVFVWTNEYLMPIATRAGMFLD
ncbi:MAG: M56 family metallopeptidase, partial [Anaerolineae bacterium]